MLKTNPQIELANEFVRLTDTNIFLTGKAGTGKTTFLKNALKDIHKRCVITAPTGVAAFNASGVTLHSLFQIPFGINSGSSAANIPSQQKYRRMNRNKLALIRSIELLVIDEISMVRCDVLDEVDKTLREVRSDSRPFGGVQLLMIGDIQQLSPICTNEQWDELSKIYSTPYFFDSNALKSCNYITIELEEVFRQSDKSFMSILNAIRDNKLSQDIIDQLNSRYIPNFKPSLDQEYITLTTHNHSANEINNMNLKTIDSKSVSFKAKIDGDFPQWSYPNSELVELKKGSQVIFIVNDPTPEKQYYNGLVGKIIDINSESVTVKAPNYETPIVVSPTRWANIEYVVNQQTSEIEEKDNGGFTQIPLKLAWAITIHKSQGLSFDRVIIDAGSSFAHGQVYVALSRCRTFEGVVLKTPITYSSIIRDRIVDGYNNKQLASQPDRGDLDRAKKLYFSNTLSEIFNYKKLTRLALSLSRIFGSYLYQEYPKLYNSLNEAAQTCTSELEKVGDNFTIQLLNAIESSLDYSSDAYIKERLKKSSTYFSERVTNLKKIIEQCSYVDSDSKEIKKQLTKIITPLYEEILVKECAIELCFEDFNCTQFNKLKYKILTKGATKEGSKSKKSSQKISEDIVHKKLYTSLQEWRLKVARQKNKPAYVVLTNKSLLAIEQSLPSTIEELESIPGIGKQKIKSYGEEILNIVEDYAINS